ncbi:SCP-like protein [Oesophagostomum dentatum]|uniref:SCP-like protein n=1 Tax=Oesophagostomum dentatum TaxID=61180 RepID=A0A0B1TGE0_OESDE|nr:SCP-like protein [Oesophagostomum dentatum]
MWMAVTGSFIVPDERTLPQVTLEATNEEYDYGNYNNSEELMCGNQSNFRKSFMERHILDILNTLREVAVAGNLPNGEGRDRYPPGKNMMEVVWNCKLAEKARKILDVEVGCSRRRPRGRRRHARLFYTQYGTDEPKMANAFKYWIEEHKFHLPKKYIGKKYVKFPRSHHQYRNLKELLNLLRDCMTSLGCAEKNCVEQRTGVNIYNVLCLSSEKPLQPREVVYSVGKGGCTSDDDCPRHSRCGERGLCRKKKLRGSPR